MTKFLKILIITSKIEKIKKNTKNEILKKNFNLLLKSFFLLTNSYTKKIEKLKKKKKNI